MILAVGGVAGYNALGARRAAQYEADMIRAAAEAGVGGSTRDGITAADAASGTEAGAADEASDPAAEPGATGEAPGGSGAEDDVQYPDFSQNEITWEGKTYKRNTYIKPILILGVDNAGSMHEKKKYGYAGQCDAIILAAHDTARNTVKLLLIPRDTMTPVMEKNRKTGVIQPYTDHLCLSYCFGDGMHESCENSRLAVQTLLMNLPITDYMAVDTSVMAVVNDAVGGVTVTIPTEGMETSDPAFVYGESVTLHGKQAERFVRFRDCNIDNSAISRMNQHRQYIAGFYRSLEAMSRKDSAIVSRLYDMMQDYMVTNMSKDRYLKAALDVLIQDTIDESSMLTLPGYGNATSTFDVYYASKPGTVKVLLSLFYRQV